MKFILTFFYIFLITANLFGQQTMDPYGFVNKYDPQFNGIGPKVYILPLPRSLEEEMKDTYTEIAAFKDTINRGLMFSALLKGFHLTSNHQLIEAEAALAAPAKLIEERKTLHDHGALYALYNLLANKALADKELDSAARLLDSADRYSWLSNHTSDRLLIRSNKAAVLLMQDALEQASALENELIAYYSSQNDNNRKAEHLTREALISAHKQAYTLAENTIIRQVIPIYNKTKDKKGKIQAWITLANIYHLQNKHTEAQWFLLQAKTEATTLKSAELLAVINYLLGYSKSMQKNYAVAEKELSVALQLTEKLQDNYLKIAIVEELGRTKVALGQYEEAKSLYTEYKKLRTALFR